MKIMLAVLLLVVSSHSFAVTAYFTGTQYQVQTVTYQIGWSCQYYYAGNYFYRTFLNYCPSFVEVQ
jgi:hypothetical protein